MAASTTCEDHGGLEKPGSLDNLKYPAVTVEPNLQALDSASKSLSDRAVTSEASHDTVLPRQDLKEYIVVSPYTTPAHLLDLSTVSRPNQLLARALSLMQPSRDDYATASYKQSFNWSAVIHRLRHLLKHETDFQWSREERFYVVVFRSRLPLSTDRVHLGALDRGSHAEATASGGLLKYWFGVPDAEGRNLATCERLPACAVFSVDRGRHLESSGRCQEGRDRPWSSTGHAGDSGPLPRMEDRAACPHHRARRFHLGHRRLVRRRRKG